MMRDFVRTAAMAVATGAILLTGIASVPRPSGSGLTTSSAIAPDPIWLVLFARPPVAETRQSEDANGVLEYNSKVERAALGRHLFEHETRLSGDGKQTCATCHQPSRAYTDGVPKALARDGGLLQRNTPTVYGIARTKLLNWDGSASSLAEQFERPITSSREMAGQWPEILRKLNRDAALLARFQSADLSAGPITKPRVLDALAAGVQSLEPPQTAFDRWLNGEAGALSQLEHLGFRIFTGKAQCVSCHFTYRFTDDRFHDVGLGGNDPGRRAVTGRASDTFKFKTPTLRAIQNTAPYMHDGSLASLKSVIRHYETGHIARASLSETMPRKLSLTTKERAALVAFLKTL